MKVIIAGSRSIQSMIILEQAIAESGFIISEVIEGEANGIDKLAKKWGKLRHIPVTPFEAAWDDLETPPVLIKVNKNGQRYNALAGFNRNQEMANYGQALIAIRKDNSPGTSDMIDRAKKANLKVYVKDL